MERVARSSVVTAAAVIMVLGALAGFGVLGTRVEDSSGGVFATDATLLTPAGPAFSIWSLIYLGLIAYTAWQWRPSTGTRASGIAWLAAASMVLNAAWILVTQVGWIWASVAVILALAVVLGLLLRRLSATPASGRAELILVDGTLSLIHI